MAGAEVSCGKFSLPFAAPACLRLARPFPPFQRAALNPTQKEELRRLTAGFTGKERKELARRAAEARVIGQKDTKNPRARWCVDRWSLYLLQQQNQDGTGEIGTVVSIAKSRAWVRVVGEDRLCELTREIAERQQSVLAPGDHVRVEPRGEGWRIREVLPRRTILGRRDPDITERQRAIVANIDIVVVVVSVVSPPLHPRLIDRYLAAIHRGGAEALIVVNKIDLHEDEEELKADLDLLEPYRAMGVPVIPVSTESGTGVEQAREHLANRVCAFVGHSGVGKSSLLAALAPSSRAVAGAVSGGTGKGTHTTTRAELVEVGDLHIIDTPGVREFAVEFRSPAEIAECFTDFATAGPCRFGDCLHVDEPGCAVRSAVEEGTLSAARYDSYRRLLEN